MAFRARKVLGTFEKQGPRRENLSPNWLLKKRLISSSCFYAGHVSSGSKGEMQNREKFLCHTQVQVNRNSHHVSCIMSTMSSTDLTPRKTLKYYHVLTTVFNLEIISQRGSYLPHDILNWVISKMGLGQTMTLKFETFDIIQTNTSILQFFMLFTVLIHFLSQLTVK